MQSVHIWIKFWMNGKSERKILRYTIKAPQNLLCYVELCLVSRWLCFCLHFGLNREETKITATIFFPFRFTLIAVCFASVLLLLYRNRCTASLLSTTRKVLWHLAIHLLSSFHRSNMVGFSPPLTASLRYNLILLLLFSLLVCNHKCVRVPMRVIQFCFCFGGYAVVVVFLVWVKNAPKPTLWFLWSGT